MSSNTTVAWQSQNNLVQIPSSTATEVINDIKTWVGYADAIIEYIVNILNIASELITSPSNLILDIIANYGKASIQVLKDILSFGGAFIVITPFNVSNPWNYEIGLSPYSLKLPSLTPQQALQEFYNSFNNTKDLTRPQWTNDVKVAGFGFMITAPDPGTLTQLISSLKLLFNFDEFDTIGKTYQTQISNYSQALNKEGKAYSSLFTNSEGTLSFDLSKFTDLSNLYSNTQTAIANGENIVQALLVSDSTTAGKLHWYGLSLENFTYLKQSVDMFDSIIKVLTESISATENIFVQMGQALISKIRGIKTIIDEVAKFITGVIVSLESEGIYYFELPPNAGGVEYVKNSIKYDSILGQSNFSAFFFAGISVGADTNAWSALFSGAFNSALADTKSVLNNYSQDLIGLVYPSFSVVPDLTSKITPFGTTLGISITSANSTQDNPLYWNVSVLDFNNNVIASYSNPGSNEHWLAVNKSSFPVSFYYPKGYDNTTPITKQYTLNINVTNSLGVVLSTYSKKFTVSNSLSLASSFIDSTSGTVTVTNKSSTTTTYVVKDSSGRAISTGYVPVGGTVHTGASSASGDTLSLELTGADGTNAVSLTNLTGKTIANINSFPLPSSIKFQSYPAMLCFDIPGVTAMKWRLSTETLYHYVTLPACFSVVAGKTYIFYFCKDGVWIGPYTLTIVTSAITGTLIC